MHGNQPSGNKVRQKEPPVSGISAAAIEGAQQGDEQRSDNAEAMARPAPGLVDPRDEDLPAGSRESTARVSELKHDQVPEDEEQQWRRAGGADPDDT